MVYLRKKYGEEIKKCRNINMSNFKGMKECFFHFGGWRVFLDFFGEKIVITQYSITLI